MATQQENPIEKITLSKGDKKFMQDWEHSQKVGFWKHIFIEGLIWGLLVGALTSIGLVNFGDWIGFLKLIGWYILGGVIGFAPTMWVFHNWRYKNIKKKLED